jgi:hypothetical protein
MAMLEVNSSFVNGGHLVVDGGVMAKMLLGVRRMATGPGKAPA